MADEEWDYQEETVIGHHVAAKVMDDSPLREEINEARKEIGLEPMDRSPMVEIEVGDVAWDGTKTVRVRLDTLGEIADVLRAEHHE